MGFFDFLSNLLSTVVFLAVLGVAVVAFFDFWCWYENKRRRDQEMLAQQKYFESQKPKILEAMMLLEEARQQIPALASQAVNQSSNGFEMRAHVLSREMDNQFKCVIAGCRMKFGDYVVRMALLNMDMDEYVYCSTDPYLRSLLGTKF
jgi:hypothetical protein